jgi:hypothetical protein
MLKNHLLVAWRNISRHRTFAFIHVIGLALGICACLVIYLTIQFEFSFDRFRPDKERIFRLVTESGSFAGMKTIDGVPPPGPAAIRQEIPGLEAVAGYYTYWARVDIPGDTGKQHPFNTWLANRGMIGSIFADGNLFRVFPFDWLAGNPSTALATPYRVVLAESRARLYFGSLPLNKIMGRELVYRDSVRVRVSGVVKDVDEHTDFPFTDIISLGTIDASPFLRNDSRLSTTDWKANRSMDCFIKIAPGASPELVRQQVAGLLDRHIPPASTGERSRYPQDHGWQPDEPRLSIPYGDLAAYFAGGSAGRIFHQAGDRAFP